MKITGRKNGVTDREFPSRTHSSHFSNFASGAARLFGSPLAFLFAVLSVMVWAILGHLYHYSEAWQLVINSVTNIVAYIMVFLIQNTQNRDSRAIHLKLDELIRSIEMARNDLIAIETLSEQELMQLSARLSNGAGRPQPLTQASEQEDGNRRPA